MPDATLFDLFWYVPRATRDLRVAMQASNTVREPVPIPAVILFPAFLTPAVHVMGGREDGMITLVVAARGDPKLTPAAVNACLRISAGLDPLKHTAARPLFAKLRRDDGKDNIVVEPPIGKRKSLEGKIVAAKSEAFRGILDRRVALPDFLDTLYEVRIHESCLAGVHPARKGDPRCQELQDLLVLEVLRKMNGPELGGKKPELEPSKWKEFQRWTPQRPAESGLCEFAVSGNQVDLGQADPKHPIVAYHPLFVYPKNGLRHANLGHVSDIHLNARQNVLARSPARVIDMADEDPKNARPELGNDSPAIGSMVNVCSSNLLSILNGLAAGMDVLLIGGDLVDHVKNVYPWARALKEDDRKNLALRPARTASEIWKLVDMKDGGAYDKNYQAFADHLTFYSILRRFYAGHRKPAYVVSGNHDCYQEAFGISPRVGRRVRDQVGVESDWATIRANEGIPADTNLTFYEAILLFGKSYGEIRDTSNFKKELLAWFYNVLTPWSDFAVQLPKQRIVGLAWGDDEKLIDAPKTGHGFGHLPRANEAVTQEQLDLFQNGLSAARKTVLFSHFTFVSYAETFSERPPPDKDKKKQPPPAKGSVSLDTDVPPKAEAPPDPNASVWKRTGRGIASGARAAGRGVESGARATANWVGLGYTECELGTFQNKRAQLYDLVHDAHTVQAVFTGHSHRKGLYYLTGKNGKSYGTEMWSLAAEVTSKKPRNADGAVLHGDKTPIVVSDSAGPLPRKNVADELLEWGSDRPSGTLVQVGKDGNVVSVAPVRSTMPQCAPRLAVAIEYLHVMKDAVLKELETNTFRWAKRLETELFLDVEMQGTFPGWLPLTDVVLYGRPSVKQHWYGGATDELAWIRIGLQAMPRSGAAGVRRLSFRVPKDARGAFCEWLAMPQGSGRFLAMRFTPVAPRPEKDELGDVARAREQVEEVANGYDKSSAWTFEADCTTTWGTVASRDTAYKLEPRLENPLWSWREKFPKYK
jgi:hypothetical protein